MFCISFYYWDNCFFIYLCRWPFGTRYKHYGQAAPGLTPVPRESALAELVSPPADPGGSPSVREGAGGWRKENLSRPRTTSPRLGPPLLGEMLRHSSRNFPHCLNVNTSLEGKTTLTMASPPTHIYKFLSITKCFAPKMSEEFFLARWLRIPAHRSSPIFQTPPVGPVRGVSAAQADISSREGESRSLGWGWCLGTELGRSVS